MCLLCSSRACGKFTVNPDWCRLKMNRFGNPRLCRPWNVATPVVPLLAQRQAVAADHLVAGTAGVVRADLEARWRR